MICSQCFHKKKTDTCSSLLFQIHQSTKADCPAIIAERRSLSTPRSHSRVEISSSFLRNLLPSSVTRMQSFRPFRSHLCFCFSQIANRFACIILITSLYVSAEGAAFLAHHPQLAIDDTSSRGGHCRPAGHSGAAEDRVSLARVPTSQCRIDCR